MCHISCVSTSDMSYCANTSDMSSCANTIDTLSYANTNDTSYANTSDTSPCVNTSDMSLYCVKILMTCQWPKQEYPGICAETDKQLKQPDPTAPSTSPALTCQLLKPSLRILYTTSDNQLSHYTFFEHSSQQTSPLVIKHQHTSTNHLLGLENTTTNTRTCMTNTGNKPRKQARKPNQTGHRSCLTSSQKTLSEGTRAYFTGPVICCNGHIANRYYMHFLVFHTDKQC